LPAAAAPKSPFNVAVNNEKILKLAATNAYKTISLKPFEDVNEGNMNSKRPPIDAKQYNSM
jgi:hypothetical protein